MNKLLAVLSLARFAGLAGGLVAIPYVGPLLGILGSVVGLLFSFLRWLLKDIEDAFKEPQRLAVRLVCVIAALAFGVWQGIEWDAHKVAAARAEVAQMKQVWKDKDDEDARKAAEAKAAREKAEAEAWSANVVPPIVAPAAVVRAKRPAAKPKTAPGLWGLFANPK